MLIRIDGSFGEGGGQILRTALSLSLVTGRPIQIDNIRAGRERPGLLRQHLTAVLAAAEIGQAQVEGAVLGSTSIGFVPGPVKAGEYRFAVGSAGSGTLVFQTVLPALMLATGPSRLVIEGGTHNDAAPPFPFLERAFLPLVVQADDPRARTVAAGIADDLTTLLARWCWFPVIASASATSARTLGYTGREIAERLGARFLVDGMVGETSMSIVQILAEMVRLNLAAPDRGPAH